MLKNELLKIKEKIVVASKYFNGDVIKCLAEFGFLDFGESKVQDLHAKFMLNLPVNWHFIGSLQTNKVREMINKIVCLHSLDSLKLAKIINKYRHEPLECFIQINLTNEISKRGLKEDELLSIYNEIRQLPKIRVIGLMTIAKAGDSPENTKKIFQRLVSLKDLLYNLNKEINSLSMGMSEDYQIALDAGATHLRLGRIMKEVLNDV